jgi:acyl dehydratase
LKFEEFKVGQTFKAHIRIDKQEFEKYISFTRTKNILHEKPELAANEGITGTLLPGRAILARVEGEMTRLDVFSNNIMLLYGMDGDPKWNNRHTRFIGEVYVGDKLEIEYTVSDKKEGNYDEKYGILSIDIQIKQISNNNNDNDKLVIVSHRNLYRIKK